MNKQELKPCPFCGYKSVSIQSEADDPEYGSGGRYYYVKCPSCRAQSGRKYVHEVCPIFYSEVRQEWNNRAALNEPDLAALVPGEMPFSFEELEAMHGEEFARGYSCAWKRSRAEMLRWIEGDKC